jgi:hypothetical protein
VLLIFGIASIIFALANSILFGLVQRKAIGYIWLNALDIVDYVILAVLWVFLIIISDPKKGAFLGGLFPLVTLVAANLLDIVFVKEYGINIPQFVFSILFATVKGALFGFSISTLSGLIRAGFPKTIAMILISLTFAVHMALMFLLQAYVFKIVFTAIFGLPGK